MEGKTCEIVVMEVDTIDDSVKAARATFSNSLANTAYVSGMKDTLLTRIDTITWKPVFTSRVQIPQIDGIFEDSWGKVWVVSLNKQISIFKFNSNLYLEESYTDSTEKSSLVFDSANPCVMDSKRECIYFPAGLSEIKVLVIKKDKAEDKNEKTAEIVSLFGSLKRALIFDMQLTADDRYLIVDEGSRSIRIIDTTTRQSFEQFLDASKEKMSRPLCLSDPQYVIFSGIIRSTPMVSLFKHKSGTLELRTTLVFEGFKVSDGKECVAGMVKIAMIREGIERVCIVTSHRRIFILQINTVSERILVESELDLSFKQRHKIEMGVKSLHFGGSTLLFYTDNKDKPTTRLTIK